MAWFSPDSKFLPDLISLNSRWLHDKPAVIVDKDITSWAEFGDRSARVANALLNRGLTHGDRVVVLMRNSGEMVEAMFGAIRAGLVTVPLNVSVSDDAIVGMIIDSNAKAIIASDDHIHRIEALRQSLGEQIGHCYIGLDATLDSWSDFATIRDAADARPPTVVVTADDECNIIYSSGTTGLPKGIVHSHSCRAAWAADMAVALRYHSGARTLCSLGLYSNITWVAMLSTILSGGTLVVQRKFNARDCLRTIQDEKISHSAMVPIQLQQILGDPDYSRFDLSSMQALMCCGSPLSAEIKQRIGENLPGDFIELYGLTEGLVTILAPEDMRAKADSVGRPYPGQDIIILDSNDNEAAVDEAGEIVGRSSLMMASYNNNDAETESATWVDSAGQRWLRSGDIGRIDEDGFLYLVDRKKDMIISGGQNIYPADIEAVMAGYAGIAELAVIGVTSKKWGETPLAVVVPAAGSTIDVEELIAWTNSKLGKQQRIAGTKVVDELPRNPNGKILKRELRKQLAHIQY